MTRQKTYNHTGYTPITAQAQQLYDLICAQPGISKTALAKTLGTYRSNIDHRLLTLESQGLLVSEDEYSNLYPFS